MVAQSELGDTMRTLSASVLAFGLTLVLSSPGVAIPQCQNCSCFNSCFDECVLPGGGIGLCIDFLCRDSPQCQSPTASAPGTGADLEVDAVPAAAVALYASESACEAREPGLYTAVNDDSQPLKFGTLTNADR